MAAETIDVITIDNFEAKIAKLDLTKRPLFALVDMGSNGIRFSTSDLSQPLSRLLPCLYRERVGISLYDALHESAPGSKEFNFSPNVISTVANSLARFASICEQFGVPPSQIGVFATEAMRTAENKDDMVKAINLASRLQVEILSPGMESLFGAMGARSGFDLVDGLFMDLGGGSVQMTYVNSADASYDILAAKAAQSMPYGAAKLTDALSTQSASDSMQQELQDIMKKTFNGLKSQFPKLKAQSESTDGITIYFCGGGFRGYGSMLMHTHDVQPYPIPTIGGFTVSGSHFTRTKDMLKANEAEGKIFGMSKRRRQQFPAIVTVVEALIAAVPRIKQVVFCSGGNREGLLYMKLPPAVRESAPLRLLPGGSSVRTYDAHTIEGVMNVVSQGLSQGGPAQFTSLPLLEYLVRNTWVDMGDPDDVNVSKALHSPSCGLVAGLPGLTHETRAIIALTLCARWGATLAPVDKPLYDGLRRLLGSTLAFWCEYVGALLAMLATLYPATPELVPNTISFTAFMADMLGKNGKKSGVKLQIRLSLNDIMIGLKIDDIEGVFSDVGKGLDVGWRVELEWLSKKRASSQDKTT